MKDIWSNTKYLTVQSRIPQTTRLSKKNRKYCLPYIPWNKVKLYAKTDYKQKRDFLQQPYCTISDVIITMNRILSFQLFQGQHEYFLEKVN